MELRKFVVPEVVHGAGALDLAGDYARKIGATRVLVVSDPGVVAAGWTGAVVRSLEQAGVAAHLFASVPQNPRVGDVDLGAEVAREARCDAIVAVGGGSPMDCAKAIGVVLANGGPIGAYEGVDRISRAIPPLLCVPTTCGSAAEVSQFAILTDLARRVKFAVVSKAIVPDVALVDGRTVHTLPPRVLAATAIDALVHAVEAFASDAHSPLTDAHALSAAALVFANLPAALAPEPDLEAQQRLMLASLHAGFAFSNASLGAVHAMAHAVGGLVDNAHGEANAALVDHVVAFNHPVAPERYDAFARHLGLDLGGLPAAGRRDALVGALRALKRTAGLAGGLAAQGVARGDVAALARAAASDPCLATNPRQPTRAELERLYDEAL